MEPNSCSIVSDPNYADFFSQCDFPRYLYSSWYVTFWQVLYLVLIAVAIFGIIYSLILLRHLVKNSDEIASKIREITKTSKE
jgi:hypothetical protein